MEQLGDEIAALYSHITAAMARWLALLAEFDAGGGWSDGGYKSCAHWLSWRCGIDIRTARDHVCVARRLAARPQVKEAFEHGELSYSKVRALLRLEDEFDEDLMLSYANSASASQLERIVRGCRRSVSVEQGAARQFAEREFHWRYDDDGAVVFGGRLPAELGAMVIRALEATRDQFGPPPKEVPDGVTVFEAETSVSPRARNADALVALAQTKLAERASSADVYQVVVHIDAEALGGSAEPRTRAAEAQAEGHAEPRGGRADAETNRPGDATASPADGSAEPRGDCRLADGEPLPLAAARRLTCDASLVRVLERDGKTLSLGRKTRTISPALRRALFMRNDTCMFPGCTQRHHTDAHHAKHWADGGETKLDNLVRLCRFHHMLVHEGGFDVRRTPRGGFTFHDPKGKVVPQAPRQPRGDCATLRRTNRERGLALHGGTLFPRDSAGENVDLGWSVTALLDSRGDPG
jgi:Domain of unknown function (DUF222)